MNMITLRRFHLFLGCFFSPLLIYFSLSGAWQVYRWNDVPKTNDSNVRSFFNNLSKPHRNSTLPGRSPKTDKSPLFSALAFLMAIGIVLTSGLGIFMALQMKRHRRWVVLALVLGVVLPILFLIPSLFCCRG